MLFRKKGNADVFCLECGEHLGKYKENFARDHLVRFPLHKEYLVKNLTKPEGLDPLASPTLPEP